MPHRIRSPLQGSGLSNIQSQGVALGYDSLPLRGGRVGTSTFLHVPFINIDHTLVLSANGAAYRSPGQRPGLDARIKRQALKGRPNSQRTEVA